MTDDCDLAADRRIAATLPRTWDAFLSRFGRLTPIQREVIPLVLDGKNVLACAPTATGKTEAACAPLVERQRAGGGLWTVLYISPTRALVNDLFGRLEAPFARLGVSLERRTGEYRMPPGRTANVLLTTPESFDSLLCRGRTEEGHCLARVVAVVLDEVHLLQGSARGEQVRWLLERLRRLRRQARTSGWARAETFQMVGLSATLADPKGLLEGLCRDGHLAVVGGGRAIEEVSVGTSPQTVEHAVRHYLTDARTSQKLLVFSNTRRRVDELSGSLHAAVASLGYSAYAHHGSLSRGERERTERVVRTRERVVVCATSTLELGIDIGDIDLVVLDGPAHDVSSLLQRIGRGNRRSGVTRVMLCSRSAHEVLVQSAMLAAAREGYLGEVERGPHFAVALQQIASYIFQARSRRRSRASLEAFISAVVPTLQGRDILDSQVAIGVLVEDDLGIGLGDELKERATSGAIHSNIEDPGGLVVVDRESGRHLATGIEHHVGVGILVGGKSFAVTARTPGQLVVRDAGGEGVPVGEWRYSARRWMRGAGQPQAVRRSLGLAENGWPRLVSGATATLFHFGGTRRMAVLALLLRSRGISPERALVNEWFVRVFVIDEDSLRPLPGAAFTLAGMLEQELPRLEMQLVRPKANRALPTNVRVEEIRQWLALDDELAAITRAGWIEVADDVKAVLTEVSRGLT